MPQDEFWPERYTEVKDFIELNHRNPSRHNPEERLREGYTFRGGYS